jgi:xanthine dehydrogenase small subunit
LISSKAIRHRATVAGNIINASPIGDLTIFLLSLDATLALNGGQHRRNLALKDFFKGYKQLDKNENELVEWISFPVPGKNTFFNFEKVSRRPHLDIASVNSAIQIQVDGRMIRQVDLSAGGVGPVPLYLSGAAAYLTGRKITFDHIREAATIAQTEISPINDVRGSSHYKRLLLRQLIFAHFMNLFPQQINEKVLHETP